MSTKEEIWADLNTEPLKTEISEDMEIRNDIAITDLYNPTRPTILVPTLIGVTIILETLGLTAGNSLLDTLYADPDYKYIMQTLEKDQLNIGSQTIRDAISSKYPDGEMDALLNLAVRADPVHFNEVSDAINWGLIQ